MKILLVSDVYRYTTNGAAGVVVILADALRAEGHEVKVLSLSTTRESFREGDDYYFSSLPFPVYPEIRQSIVIRHPYIEELKAWRPDVIHIHTEGSAARLGRIISRATHAPIVMTMHTDYAKFVFHDRSDARVLKWAGKPLTSFFYRGAKVVTTPSKKAKMLLLSYHFRKKVVVIPNGIKLDRFRRDYEEGEREELFAQWGIPDNGKLFVIISRLSLEKNIEEILEYFADVVHEDPEAYLLVVGDGPDMNHLQKYTGELGVEDHVVFTGRISQEVLYRYYKAGTAFLSASTFEMHSLTYLEALACGLPLICRDDPCLAGVLQDGKNGFIYHTKEEFVDRCLTMIRDREGRDRMAQASLNRSEVFSDKALARRMVRLYRRITGQSEE